MNEFQEYYYSHPYARELDTFVLSCHACKEGYEIVLKDTIFYPEGGGQPCDKGTIQGITVLDVQRKEDKIVHILKQPLPLGEKVHCVINWEHRYDLMQNHTGKNIFLGKIKKFHTGQIE